MDSVVFTVPAASQREALERVWALGGEVLSVNPVRRTLEEVFVSWTEGKGSLMATCADRGRILCANIAGRC